MSKNTKVRTNQQTLKDNKIINSNPLENYFGSPDTGKNRKKSMDSSNSETPPPKRAEGGKDKSPIAHKSGTLIPASTPAPTTTPKGTDKEDKPPLKQITTTPTSDKVCKHLDSQLTDMEKRLKASLSASLSASIAASVTAGLKGLIDDSLKTALETMTKTVNETIDEHPTIKQHGEQLDSLETENLILKNKVSCIEGENSQMKHRLANIESRALQHNIILRGVPEEDWEKESTTRHKVYIELSYLIKSDETNTKELNEDELKTLRLKAIKKKIEIRSCKRIGRYIKDRSRPISIELLRRDNIDFILTKKKELRTSVFADKEYPQDIENNRKILRPILTVAKNSNKYRKRCRMENDQLVIKGKRYGINDLDTLPKSLLPHNITSKSNSDVYGYFGELHPLSNFYPAEFSLENKTFHCSEQYIQWKKAELFKDKTAMSNIERCKNGRQCKEEGRKIKNFKKSTWDTQAKNLC